MQPTLWEGGETMDWELGLGPVPLSHTISVWPWSRAGAEGKDLRGVSLVRQIPQRPARGRCLKKAQQSTV